MSTATSEFIQSLPTAEQAIARLRELGMPRRNNELWSFFPVAKIPTPEFMGTDFAATPVASPTASPAASLATEPAATAAPAIKETDFAALLPIANQARPMIREIVPGAAEMAMLKCNNDFGHTVLEIGKNAKVGNNTEIYSNAVIYHDCQVGNNCILHAGSVIGADGFGFQPTEKGYDKIPQIGIAIIEDDVEIGANTCVDRAVMGATIVHKGVKLDNLVQIAHNDEIGSHTVMSAQVGIAGSTKVGEWCMFGGQVGIAGHATIADRTMAGAQAGIPNNIKKPGTAVQGTPAIDAKTFWKSSAIFKNLYQMWADMNEIKKEIKTLKDEFAAKK